MHVRCKQTNKYGLHHVVIKSDAFGEFIPSLDLVILEIVWSVCHVNAETHATCIQFQQKNCVKSIAAEE